MSKVVDISLVRQRKSAKEIKISGPGKLLDFLEYFSESQEDSYIPAAGLLGLFLTCGVVETCKREDGVVLYRATEKFLRCLESMPKGV